MQQMRTLSSFSGGNMQRASTHYGCCDAHELSTHGHSGASIFVGRAEYRSPFKGRGPSPISTSSSNCFCLSDICCVPGGSANVHLLPARSATSMAPSFFASPVMRLGVSYLFLCRLSVRNNISRADAAGRPGSSRETTMTSSARFAAAVICMSAVVACSRTERTVVQPAPAPTTVVTPAPAGSVVTTQPASTTVYTTR